jgi:thiol:disulfide interchange protein DsbC
MKLSKTILAAVALASATSASFAQNDPEMIATLRRIYPSTQFKSVVSTPVDGIFEVVMGKNVAYVDRSGKYFFFGTLFDMPGQRDLTQAKVEEVKRIDVGQLPLQDAIKTVKGNGERTLIVFSDPDCPFCQQLENTLRQVTDVTIYTFLFPIDSLHPDARRKATNVWCSQNPARAWNALMLNKKESPDVSCKHPVDRNISLAASLDINGTPTLLSVDGRKIAGVVEAERLNAWLDAAKPAATRQAQQ